MVKKVLENGEPCRKCAQTEQMLRGRGLWDRIDEVIVADSRDPESAGMKLAAEHGVDVAPFFLVEEGGETTVQVSALRLIRDHLTASAANSSVTPAQVDAAATELAAASPGDIIAWGLERFGADCAIAFSGAEDVVLIDMAAKTGKPFSVFCLDTGRLHPETHVFIDRVRSHYGVDIRLMSPDAAKVEALVRSKGLFSFFEDGHKECCGIRKVQPLRRALGDYRAWITGQRHDQSPETRAELPVVQMDPAFAGIGGGPLVKLNPLAEWTSQRVWDYINVNEIPFNELHSRGFVSIGCAPCTRPVLPGQHEREGRWWWERADAKECGLHVAADSE